MHDHRTAAPAIEATDKIEIGKEQFWREVFPAELEEVKARRVEQGLDASRLQGPANANMGLTGLALSGGGIRSATFCLGALQVFAKKGLLPRVDFLSTVSGGGFIGSCLSSVLQGGSFKDFVECKQEERHRMGSAEPLVIRHLRNSSKYLAPGGLLDTLRLPALILRGMISNFFLILPYLMLMVIATEILYQSSINFHGFYQVLPFIAPAALLGAIFVFPFLSRFSWSRMDWKKRDWYERGLGLLFLFTLISLLLGPLIILIMRAIRISWHEFLASLHTDWQSFFEFSDIWKWLGAFVVLHLVFRLSFVSGLLSRWRNRIVLYGVGLLGPLAVFFLYLGLCVFEIDSPFLGEHLPMARAKASNFDLSLLEEKELHEHLKERLGLAGHVAIEAAPKQNIWKLTQPVTGERYQLRLEHGEVALFHDYRSELKEGKITPALQKAFERKGTLSASARILDHKEDDLDDYEQWTLADQGKKFLIWVDKGRLRTDKPLGWGDRQDWYFLGTALILFLANFFFVNINVTSAHGFYRDRLSRAYLVTPHQEELRFNDRQLLSELGKKGGRGPLHLINVALNLKDSPEAIIRGRHSDFFFFSKLFSGSEITGYCHTEKLEKADSHLDLGTAMAISGAAASPNAGVTTVGPLIFILTMLNLRLGYWLPNPRRLRKAGPNPAEFLRHGPPPHYLLKEALGILNATGRFINISDGGHIENLGIYELLRRRCKVIISVDSEADAEFRFGGLLRLITYARVDMGIDIEIDLAQLRKGPVCWNCGHAVLGKIHYGDNETGYLLYIKSTMTGDEDEGLRGYREDFPTFPHESTTDQFFSESQFEAYRRLGHHAAECAIEAHPAFFEMLGLASEAGQRPVSGNGAGRTPGSATPPHAEVSVGK